jgi:transcriptional regulator with XRE-family HTH domain
MAKRYRSRTKHYVHLDEVIDSIFEEADEQNISINRLADKAGVCVKTIENLCERVTMYPRYKTIWSLANAVGLIINLKATVQYRAVG